MSEIKVLHIISGFGGGIASFIQNKAESLAGENIVFDAVTFNEPPLSFTEAILKTGGKVYQVSNPKKTSLKKFYQEVSEVFRKQPRDLYIHSHIQGYRAFPFYLMAKKFGYKTFGVHAHQSASPYIKSRSMKRLENTINNVMATDYLSCGKLASEFVFGQKIVAENKVMHIPNSIDPDNYFNMIDVQRKKEEVLGESVKDTLIIGHVGRFNVQKNHPFMIEIIKKLRDMRIDFKWLFLGNGELKEEIEKVVEQEKLDQHVLFLGHRKDVAEMYKVMDVLVLPSFNEGLPTVAVEAQAAGTICLLSDSITDEVDLEMGLVQYLPLNDLSKWVNALIATEKVETSAEERLKILHDKKFTNAESAELYKLFLEKKLSHYEI